MVHAASLLDAQHLEDRAQKTSHMLIFMRRKKFLLDCPTKYREKSVVKYDVTDTQSALRSAITSPNLNSRICVKVKSGVVSCICPRNGTAMSIF